MGESEIYAGLFKTGSGVAQVKELARRLHSFDHQPLYSGYAADRDQKKETLLAQTTSPIVQYDIEPC
jgi:hypothetical protein